MSNLENVNTETSIANILGGTKGVGTSPLTSNWFRPDELDTTIDYINEQIKIAKSPGINLGEYGVSEDAFFPESRSPQRVYSGKTFTAPLIAPEGGLFPYAVLNARQAEEKLAKQRMLEQGAVGEYEYAELEDLDKNITFHKATENIFNRNWNKSVAMSREKHGGSGAYAGYYAKTGMEKTAREAKNIAKLWNESYGIAKTVLSDTDFYTKAQVEDAREMIRGADLIKEDMTQEDWDKMVKIIGERGEKLVTKHKSLNTFVGMVTKDLADRTMVNVKQLEGIGDADFNKVQQMTHKSPFLKLDDNNEIVFDEEAALENIKIWYDDIYKLREEEGRQGQEPEGGFEDVSKVVLSRIKHKIVPKLDIAKKDMSYREHALKKDLIDYKKDVKVVTSNDRDTNLINKQGDTVSVETKTWDFGDGISIESTDVGCTYNPLTRETEKIVGTRPYTLRSLKQTTKQDKGKNVVFVFADAPKGEKITYEEYRKRIGEKKEGIISSVKGWYQDDKGKVFASEGFDTKILRYSDVVGHIDKAGYTKDKLDGFLGVKGTGSLVIKETKPTEKPHEKETTKSKGHAR